MNEGTLHISFGGREREREMGSRGDPGSVAQIPTSFGHELRACLRCRLVKTYDQFRESGCENCPFFGLDKDHERVVECTAPNFTGLISVMDPTRSWAARWLRIGHLKRNSRQFVNVISRKHPMRCSEVLHLSCCQVEIDTQCGCPGPMVIGRFVPGCYTLAVSEALPEEFQAICEDERVQYVPPKRV